MISRGRYGPRTAERNTPPLTRWGDIPLANGRIPELPAAGNPAVPVEFSINVASAASPIFPFSFGCSNRPRGFIILPPRLEFPNGISPARSPGRGWHLPCDRATGRTADAAAARVRPATFPTDRPIDPRQPVRVSPKGSITSTCASPRWSSLRRLFNTRLGVSSPVPYGEGIRRLPRMSVELRDRLSAPACPSRMRAWGGGDRSTGSQSGLKAAAT
jgi:hypothetical protein